MAAREKLTLVSPSTGEGLGGSEIAAHGIKLICVRLDR
jgi:hypothetical protein